MKCVGFCMISKPHLTQLLTVRLLSAISLKEEHMEKVQPFCKGLTSGLSTSLHPVSSWGDRFKVIVQDAQIRTLNKPKK